MKTKTTILSILTSALMVLAATSCQKEETTDPIIPTDTTQVPDNPDPQPVNYMIWDQDSIQVHHCIFQSTTSSGGSISLFVYGCNHPNQLMRIILHSNNPSPNPQQAMVGIGNIMQAITLQNAFLIFDTVDNGYKIDLVGDYSGKRLELHFAGPISDPDKPAGLGIYKRGNYESEVKYNICQEYNGQYQLFFNSHTQFSPRNYYYFRLDLAEPIAPGTYSNDQIKLFRCIENSVSCFDYATDCTLTLNRQGDIWELELTGTIDGTEIAFNYSGALNFLYLNE